MRTVISGMTFHDMRHTAVSIWIALGATEMEVAALAGHRSVTFTKDRYGHLFPSYTTRLVQRLDAYIDEAANRPTAAVIALGRLGSPSENRVQNASYPGPEASE
jgi:integrase